MKFMISSAPIGLNSSLKLSRTRAAAARNCARRSPFTAEPTGVVTILLPSRLNTTSLPGTMPAAMQSRLGVVTCPFSVSNTAVSSGMNSKQEEFKRLRDRRADAACVTLAPGMSGAQKATARCKPGRCHCTPARNHGLAEGIASVAHQFATGNSRQFIRRIVPALPKEPGGACSSPLSLPAISRGTPLTVKKRKSVTTPVRLVL